MARTTSSFDMLVKSEVTSKDIRISLGSTVIPFKQLTNDQQSLMCDRGLFREAFKIQFKNLATPYKGLPKDETMMRKGYPGL